MEGKGQQQHQLEEEEDEQEITEKTPIVTEHKAHRAQLKVCAMCISVHAASQQWDLRTHKLMLPVLRHIPILLCPHTPPPWLQACGVDTWAAVGHQYTTSAAAASPRPHGAVQEEEEEEEEEEVEVEWGGDGEGQVRSPTAAAASTEGGGRRSSCL